MAGEDDIRVGLELFLDKIAAEAAERQLDRIAKKRQVKLEVDPAVARVLRQVANAGIAENVRRQKEAVKEIHDAQRDQHKRMREILATTDKEEGQRQKTRRDTQDAQNRRTIDILRTADKEEGQRQAVKRKEQLAQHRRMYQILAQQEREARAVGDPAKSWFQNMQEAVARGQWRRGIAMGVSQLLGGGPAASFIGGMAGGIGSAIFLPIGWQIGQGILDIMEKLPGMVLRERETSAFYRAGAGSPDGGAAVAGESEAVRFWGNIPEGHDEWRKTAVALQNAGLSDEEVVKRANQIMLLAHGTPTSPDAYAETYRKAMRYRGGSQGEFYSAMLQNQFFEDAAMAKYGQQFARRPASMKYQQFGEWMRYNLGAENINAILDQAAQNQMLQGRVGSTTTGMLGILRGTGARALYQISRPIDSGLVPAGKGEGVRGAAALAEASTPIGQIRFLANALWDAFAGTPAVKNVTGLNEPNRTPAMKPEPREWRTQWTSFSGLAEQMQMMWGGAPLQDNTNAISTLTLRVEELNARLQSNYEKLRSGGRVFDMDVNPARERAG